MKRHFFFVVLCSFNCFAGKVVFLHGTGCAGKTSLCNELLQQSNEWKLVSEDDIYYKEAVQRWKNEFSEQFNVIEKTIEKENMLHAVMRNQVLFTPDANESDRAEALKAIGRIQEELNSRSRDAERQNPNSWHNRLRREITQTIIDLAKDNHVIVDTWFLKEEHIDTISKQYDVVHIAAYCPFLDLVKRTMKRNYDALMNGKNISNLRFFQQALCSFTGLYDVVDVEGGSIDALEKRDVIHGCDLVQVCLHDSVNATGATKSFTRGEFSLQEFEEYRRSLLALFTKKTAFIHTKRKLATVIRTDRATPGECAKIVMELVK